MVCCGDRHGDASCVQIKDHPWHLGWSEAADEMVFWPNTSYQPPKATTKQSAAQALTEMAERVEPAE